MRLWRIARALSLVMHSGAAVGCGVELRRRGWRVAPRQKLQHALQSARGIPTEGIGWNGTGVHGRPYKSTAAGSAFAEAWSEGRPTAARRYIVGTGVALIQMHREGEHSSEQAAAASQRASPAESPPRSAQAGVAVSSRGVRGLESLKGSARAGQLVYAVSPIDVPASLPAMSIDRHGARCVVAGIEEDGKSESGRAAA